MIDPAKISGITNFEKLTEQLDEHNSRDLYKIPENGKVFLIVNKNTFELRTDDKLGKLVTSAAAA